MRVCVMIALVLLATLAGCGDDYEPLEPPRTRDEIFNERVELPALYLTAESNTRVIANRGRGAFVDEGTGELAWPAFVCHRPECPAREGDEPVLFIAPDPTVVLMNGKIVNDINAITEAPTHLGQCPKCLKDRRIHFETKEQKAQFMQWARPYELPEAATRMKELEAERKRRIRLDRQQAIIDSSKKK